MKKLLTTALLLTLSFSATAKNDQGEGQQMLSRGHDAIINIPVNRSIFTVLNYTQSASKGYKLSGPYSNRDFLSFDHPELAEVDCIRKNASNFLNINLEDYANQAIDVNLRIYSQDETKDLLFIVHRNIRTKFNDNLKQVELYFREIHTQRLDEVSSEVFTCGLN